MQASKYVCDGCTKDIENTPHITLFIGGSGMSGIAMPPEGEGAQWSVTQNLDHFVHFHNGTCAKLYFDAKMDLAAPEPKSSRRMARKGKK